MYVMFNACLFVATPSATTFFNCTKITNDSLTLQWSEPADNGGEELLLYIITRSIRNTITYFVFTNNTAKMDNLQQNNTYSFSIRAGNSIGFGPPTSVNCTTEENNSWYFLLCIFYRTNFYYMFRSTYV